MYSPGVLESHRWQLHLNHAGEGKEIKMVLWKCGRKVFICFGVVLTGITFTVIFWDKSGTFTKSIVIVLLSSCFELSFLLGDVYMVLNFILTTRVR